MKSISQEIVRIAKGEVGVEEVNGTNCGPRVNQYKAATFLPPDQSWLWCAAFVCWVIREALIAIQAKETATFKRPRTAGAWDMENWSLAQDSTTWTLKPHRGDIEAGDIVIFTFSHIGIATSSPDSNGMVHTVEGNSNNGGSREGGAVVTHYRQVSKIRSRIRFRQDRLIPA